MNAELKFKLKNSKILIPSLILISGLLLIVSLGFGYYKLNLKEVFRFIFGTSSDPFAKQIIENIRIPRVLSAFFIGLSLSASGAAYQGVFKNPLVAPDILGVSSGCSMGAESAIGWCGCGLEARDRERGPDPRGEW